jgi:hypothetical protein
MGRQVDNQVQWALDYILTTYDEDNLKKKRSELRSSIYDFIMDNGEPDEDGNLIYKFDKPMTIDDNTWFSGFMLQRRISEFVDEDKAMAIIEKYGLQDTCIYMTPVIDYDNLYAANQKGIIPDKEIDELLEQEETWALIKMKV